MKMVSGASLRSKKFLNPVKIQPTFNGGQLDIYQIRLMLKIWASFKRSKIFISKRKWIISVMC